MANTKLKTLVLLDILREETDAEHRLAVPELVNRLADRGITAERKGVYRDIESLIEHGEDVIKTTDGYYLGKRKLDIPEIRLLLSAVQAANFISPERSEALMEKLLSNVSRHAARSLKAQCNMGGIKCKTDEVLHTIDVLNQAIASRKQVSFAYYRRNVDKQLVRQRAGRRYTVNPYALIWMMDRYYLVCNMDERNDLTHFRLDRIRALRAEAGIWRHFKEVCRYKDKFDQADYVKRCVNMFGDKLRMVTIRCEKSVSDEIFDKFGTDIIINSITNTHFNAIINLAAGDGFLAWASQWGDKVEVLAPEDVRAAMKTRVNKIAELYK